VVETTPFTFDSILDSGETLLWSGQPKQGLRLRASDAYMIPFSLMWGGFAIFWETMALAIPRGTKAGDEPHDAGLIAWFFPLWGIPFVAMGLYIIFGRFFYDAAVRKKTFYAITNQRLIILKTLFSQNIASFDYAGLNTINVTERGDKSGDILFGTPNGMSSFAGSGWPGSVKSAVPGFYLLPDARQVYERIRQAQRQSK
jgi:hypothetical protein